MKRVWCSSTCLKDSNHHSVREFHTKSDLQNYLHSKKIIPYSSLLLFLLLLEVEKCFHLGNTFQKLENISSILSCLSKKVLAIHLVKCWNPTCSDAKAKKRWCLRVSLGTAAHWSPFLTFGWHLPQQPLAYILKIYTTQAQSTDFSAQWCPTFQQPDPSLYVYRLYASINESLKAESLHSAPAIHQTFIPLCQELSQVKEIQSWISAIRRCLCLLQFLTAPSVLLISKCVSLSLTKLQIQLTHWTSNGSWSQTQHI